MQSDKILSLLGFASKAGKLSFGFNKSKESLKNKKSFLIIAADNLSDKSLKEIVFFAEKENVKHIILKDIDTLSKAVGHTCGIISVNDKGFADACLDARVKEEMLNDQ